MRRLIPMFAVAHVFVVLAAQPVISRAAEPVRVSDGLVALYTFDAQGGDTIADRSAEGSPLDLKIEKLESVQWLDGCLHVIGSSRIRSEKPAKKIVDAIKRTNAVTIEAWIRPERDNQTGPARIVSLSADPSQRNFTLGQDEGRYDVRLRTSKTNANGVPSTAAPDGTARLSLTHVVFTRGPGGAARIYIDGKQSVSKKVAGRFNNWDDQYPLSLVNEATDDRPWLGEIYLVAIYQRALHADEVLRNYQAGARAGVDPQAAERLALAQAERTFATQVAPLLARNCIECHDSALKKGDLDLSHKSTAMAGGESGPVIVPGNVDASLLWEQIESGDMPPQGESLNSADKALIKQWITDGAVWSVDMIDPAVYAAGVGASESWVQRLTVSEYVETVRSTVGVDIATEARELLPPDLRADGFSNTAYNLNVDLKHVEAYAQLAQVIVERLDVSGFAARFSKNRSLNTDRTAREFVANVGEWLLRGPLDEREVTNYSGILTSVASAGGSFEEGVGLMVEAMLQSPRFLYRIEQQRGGGEGSRRVSAYELAARLSYIIWGGPPDEELLRAARDGELLNSDRCRQQVQRMFQDPRAVNRSKQFIFDWLNLNRLSNMQPNPERYPEWNAELGRDMQNETLAFFEEIVWKQNRPLSELFNAQFTFATPLLAQHYGLQSQGDGLRQYDLSDVPARGGLLTQGSVLTIGGDDASMVTRGLFVMKDLLRGVIGAPPPGVDTTPVPAKQGTTLRDIAEERIEKASCGGCHKKFEPLAFGLEQFDGLGGFNKQDEFGNRLRSDGQLIVPGLESPLPYETPAELMDLLANSDRIRDTIAWKLTQFSLGRPLGARDAVEVQHISRTAYQEGGTYVDLITAIVMSDLVQRTRP
ncbi:MAG: DUF1592 domain-containing protein, partial [Planctomycetales bacterium]|nr:DUF1592 domain-containing protein [Planctomycetales bacterium]